MKPVQENSIYPIDFPKIEFLPNQDFILMAVPAGIQAMMPNGVGHVHNILKKSGVRFQTIDLDMIYYHRFHSNRILNEIEMVVSDQGFEMKDDPWDPTGIEEYWNKQEVVDYFRRDIDETIKGLIDAKPKMIGISIHNGNHSIAKEIAKGVRSGLPDVLIVAGGYSCVHYKTGPIKFPLFDYMVVGEAELTFEPLVKALNAGERPKDLPGVISKHDTPGREWVPGQMLHDLDSIDFPRYDWVDVKYYRTYNGKRLTPIITSRGCKWSKCRFCAERFLWRIRSPKNIVDELEWLSDHGSTVFQINDSDLNGKPEILAEACKEVIRRKLKIVLTGQLRIHKKSDREYFDLLKEAGFTRLRFGVDAWTDNLCRRQLKGYNMKLVDRNLRDCSEAGIYVSVNCVVGVPGETEEDVKETSENILRNKKHIKLVESIRSLLLQEGSVYRDEPEKHNIHFRGNKDEIYSNHPIQVPDKLWYSEEPYIDHKIRQERWRAVAKAVVDGGVMVGNYVKARADGNGGKIDKKLINAENRRLLEEGYRGYNIILCDERIYGLSQGAGRLDLSKVNTKGYPCVVGDSVEEVKRLITDDA